MSSRRTAGPLRGISGLLLGAVAAAGLVPLADARRIERAPDHLVADTGEVLHPATADQHDRVLLEIVPFPGDVRRHLETAGEADPGHLAERRVGLLRGVGVDAGAHSPTLGRAPEGRGLRLGRFGSPAFADELGDRGHALPLRCGLRGYFRTYSGTSDVLRAGRTHRSAYSRKEQMLRHPCLPGKRGPTPTAYRDRDEDGSPPTPGGRRRPGPVRLQP